MLTVTARSCWIQNTGPANYIFASQTDESRSFPKMESAVRIALHVSQKEGANTLQCHACIYTCWHIWKKLASAYTSMHGMCFSQFMKPISCSEESHTTDSCSRSKYGLFIYWSRARILLLNRIQYGVDASKQGWKPNMQASTEVIPVGIKLLKTSSRWLRWDQIEFSSIGYCHRLFDQAHSSWS